MAAYRLLLLLLLLLLIQVAVAFDQCLIHHIDVVSYHNLLSKISAGSKQSGNVFYPNAMPGYSNWVYCIALDDPPSGDVVT